MCTEGEAAMNRSTSRRKRIRNTAIAIFAFALSLGLIVSSNAKSYRSEGDQKKVDVLQIVPTREGSHWINHLHTQCILIKEHICPQLTSN
jgi:hypothetical protein